MENGMNNTRVKLAVVIYKTYCMEDVRFMVCPLVSSDLYRAKRAIQSCFNQENHNLSFEVHVVINSQDKDFIDEIVYFCEYQNIKYYITESNGTPSQGKNSVFEIFNKSKFTHLAQLDGDDFYYPTFLRHMDRHLRRYPNTDVLGVVPVDIVGNMKPHLHYEEIGENLFVTVWNSNFLNLSSILPWGTDPMFTDTSTHNWCRHNFFTKKITRNFKYDVPTVVGEDHRLHFELFKAHIDEKITYFFSTASDTFVNDRTGESIQKTFSGKKTENGVEVQIDYGLLHNTKNYISTFLEANRSSPAELPFDVAPMYLSYDEKINFIKNYY